VATSDQAQRLTVIGYGAEWMSAKILAQAIEQSRSQVKQQQRQRQRRSRRDPLRNGSQSRGWVSNQDPSVQDKLSQWRYGMD
jgi:predicted RNA-binding protein with PIN domain